MTDKQTLIDISHALGDCLKYILERCSLHQDEMLYVHLVKTNLNMLMLSVEEYIQKSQAQQVTNEGIQLFINHINQTLKD